MAQKFGHVEKRLLLKGHVPTVEVNYFPPLPPLPFPRSLSAVNAAIRLRNRSSSDFVI